MDTPNQVVQKELVVSCIDFEKIEIITEKQSVFSLKSCVQTECLELFS